MKYQSKKHALLFLLRFESNPNLPFRFVRKQKESQNSNDFSSLETFSLVVVWRLKTVGHQYNFTG